MIFRDHLDGRSSEICCYLSVPLNDDDDDDDDDEAW